MSLSITNILLLVTDTGLQTVLDLAG